MPSEQNSSLLHQPVLYQETIAALRPTPAGRYLDGTLGAGGHAFGILEATNPDGMLLGLDVDPQALSIAKERLADFGERAKLLKASYGKMAEICKAEGCLPLDGILLDVGASSIQFDRAERRVPFQE